MKMIYKKKVITSPGNKIPLLTVHVDQYFSTFQACDIFSKYTEVRGPPDLRAVAHRLRATGLALKLKHMDKCKLYEFFAFELITGQFDDLQNFFQHPRTSARYTLIVVI